MIDYTKKSYGIPVGVVTDMDDWEEVFLSSTFCPESNIAPLWWSPDDEEQDLKPDFDGYNQIGGWKQPFMKMYRLV